VKTVLALSWQSSPQQNISMLSNLQAIPPPPPFSSTHPTIPFICLLICYVVYFPSICNGELFGFMYEFNFQCFCLFVCLWKINVIIIIIIIMLLKAFSIISSVNCEFHGNVGYLICSIFVSFFSYFDKICLL
jgi:uncharacterized membrane protein